MRKIRVNFDMKLGKFIIIGIITLVFIIPIIVANADSKNVSNEKIHVQNSEFYLDESNVRLNNKMIVVSKVKVFITRENKIKEMDVEEYVQGVVCGEMPANFELDALKAQAVVARTYTLAHMISLGGSGCSKNSDADLCDTVHCQVYKSREEQLKEWPVKDRDLLWQKVSEAVRSTTGLVLTYEGELVMSPLYFSMSSGKTYNSQEVFSSSRPYLKSVVSEGENNVKDFQTTVTINNSIVANKINKSYSKANIVPSNLKNQIKILSRGSGNNVINIKVGDVMLTGNQFRTILELKSPDFNLKFNNSSISITCFGSGHGVGMSQWGANIMAQKGNAYSNILLHYYQGVKIESVKYK